MGTYTVSRPGGGDKSNAGSFSFLTDCADRAIGVMERFRVDRDHVGSRITEGLDPPIGVVDLEVQAWILVPGHAVVVGSEGQDAEGGEQQRSPANSRSAFAVWR